MELNLPYGPWHNLASAKWNDHPLSIYINSEKIMMLVVFDKENTENKGVLLLLRKPFKVEGSLQEMLSHQKKDLTLIEKIVDGQSMKFVLLDATPKYLPYAQSELFKALKEQHLELEGSSKIFNEVAQNYSIKALELSKCSEAISETLYGDPFTLFASPGVASSGSGFTFRSTNGLLGVNKDNDLVDINVNLTYSYKIFGGEKKNRTHALQIITENALLNSVPCIIFDAFSTLKGLALPNKNVSEYKEFKMIDRPIGFPLKSFSLGSGLFVDLKLVPIELFTELMGLKEFEKILKESWGESTLEDLIKKTSEITEGREITKYSIDKTIRMLKVIQKAYPSTFAEANYSEYSNPWSEGVGRVLFFDLNNTPIEIRQLLEYAIIENLGNPTNSSLSLLLVFTDNGKEAIHDKIKEKLSKLSEKNIAYAVTADQQIELNGLPEAQAIIEFVSSEAFLVRTGERFRFTLRPTYSLPADQFSSQKEPQTAKK